jgi:hypothetical protein
MKTDAFNHGITGRPMKNDQAPEGGKQGGAQFFDYILLRRMGQLLCRGVWNSPCQRVTPVELLLCGREKKREKLYQAENMNQVDGGTVCRKLQPC